MIIKDLEKFSKNIKSEVFFDYEIKNYNWFNIGGKTKVFFKPNSLKELIEFLKLYSHRGKIFTLGAGSNVLFNDKTFQGSIIKLGKSFSNLSLLNKDTIIAGASSTQKKLSEFAKDNNIGGLEFMSCIPGSVGGGIRMNSGCFNKEFKDVLISLQVIDFDGQIKTIPSSKINFKYRGNDLPKDIIFLSATFKGSIKIKSEIQNYMKELKEKKEASQPTRLKTSGSTFKNPSGFYAAKLIEEAGYKGFRKGDAMVSDLHSNFLINTNNASASEIEDLGKLIIDKVYEKFQIVLEWEIKIIGELKK